MKKETLAIIIIIILMSLFFGIQETKALETDKYYIAHKYLSNNSYYIGFFNNKPTINNFIISDTENITYYKFSTYESMFNALKTNDYSDAIATTTDKTSMKLNNDSSYMYFSNFDLYNENNELYFNSNPFNFSSDIKGKPIEYNINKIDSMLDFLYNGNPTSSYGNSTKKYFDETFIPEKKYLEYGKYYFLPAHNGSYGTRCYITDYPELIYYDDEFLNNVKIKYDENKPVYEFVVVEGKKDSSSGYITEDIIRSHQMFNEYNYARTNIEEIYYNDDNNVGDLIFVDGTIIKDGDIFSYLNNGRMSMYSPDPYKQLTLKKTFNSGTNAGAMGKIVWDINAYGDIAAMDGLLPFKIQFGSNDFTIKNIPKFSSYKIYGSNSFESGWDDITNDERFYFDEFNFEKHTLEGSLTETIMTSTLNIPSDMCVYENIKVEFYFDNTSNFYLYTFDDMTTNFNEGWSDVEYYFNDYIYYEFPKNTRYAFISSKTIDNIKGKIYFPYNFSDNTNSLLGAYMYDYLNNNVLYSIDNIPFEENDYYHYFDFDYILSQGQIMFLERKTNTEEVPYFYLHKDYFVEFRDERKFEIQTPNGWIEIDTGKIDNPYSKVENENNEFSFDEILDFFKNLVNGDNPLFTYINEVYKKIRGSKLGNYILIIIVSSIIILLIKSLKR